MSTHACWKWIAAALLASAPPLFATSPAAPDAVHDLGQYLVQQGYVPMRVDNNGRNQEMVRISINGCTGTLALDTGCGRTCITTGFARHLKLEIGKADPIVGVGGRLEGSGVAVLDSFTLNNSEINHTGTIRVLPPGASAPEDGLLGYDYMRLNSVIVPVGANFFLYKPGSAPPPEINSVLKASGYQAIPLTFGEGGLRAEGSLDGHPLVAVVDSGASYTLFDSAFVKMTVGALVSRSRLISWGIDGRPAFVGIFEADKLTFGALTFPPTITATANGTTLPAIHAQALLGYDLLAKHRAIIDLGHNVLWMK
ncbi:MAG TPA: pepsin/retropepsin-like aspartic protease family protein [Candidatus Methylacidiphilales bacterium]|jgi:predicted aspartyl protease|nr:pepsin/retropepsin-like aspartic protease family protein [Candidatus Methylacidiphilales bacterium]